MANDKSKDKGASAATKTIEKPIDFSQYLPAGYDAGELQKVGGLVPLVPAEVMFERKAVVAGWVIEIIDMPPRPSMSKKGEKEDWKGVLIELTGPTFAQSGDDVIERKAGDAVVIPFTGSLKNNRPLIVAAADPEKMYLGLFRVVGQVDTGKPSPMWDYEVQLHPKPRVRTGAYLLSGAAPKALPAHNATMPATTG